MDDMARFDFEQARHVVELMELTAWADGRVEGSEALARVMGADRAFPLEEESVRRKLEELFGLSFADLERLLVLSTR